MEFQKILVLRLSAVGDVIRTLPAVKILKEIYPSSYIAWIVEEPSYSLLRSQPEVDEVILFPRRRWVKGIRSFTRMGATLGEMWNFLVALRKHRFDVVLDFHGILKSGILSSLSGSPRRIGYDRPSTKEMNFLFSNIKVSLPKEKISRFQRNIMLLKGIGKAVKQIQYHLYIPQEDEDYIASFFKKPFKRPLIAIHPGTSPKAIFKRWMPDRYAQLSDRLVRELDATILFTWGEGELDLVERIQKKMNECSILAPQTKSLTQLGEVYKHCDLYIGGDTGPMHIASLMGTPVVVLYGPTDPIENEPFGNHIKVRNGVGCNPCHHYSCKELHCMRSISVEDVFRATQKILSNSPLSPFTTDQREVGFEN